MTNTVTFQVLATPGNAELINQISKMLISGFSGEETSDEKPTKQKRSTTSKSSVTFAQFKKAAQAAKKEHGSDFVVEILEASDYKGSSIPKTLSAVDEDDYTDIIELWEAGPVTEATSDEPEDEDDDFEDDEEEVEITSKDVRMAAKAYSKENGRDEAMAVLKKHKCKNLAAIDDLSSAKLVSLFKALQ